MDDIIRISESWSDSEVLTGAIYFLRQTGKQESVDALFKMVERLDDELYENLKGYMWDALFKGDSVLMKRGSKLIDRKSDELLDHEDPRVKERARELSDRSYYGSIKSRYPENRRYAYIPESVFTSVLTDRS